MRTGFLHPQLPSHADRDVTKASGDEQLRHCTAHNTAPSRLRSTSTFAAIGAGLRKEVALWLTAATANHVVAVPYGESMGNVNPPIGHASDSDYNDNDTQLYFDFDITIVGGEQGRLLAQLQAHSILEVLEWFSRQPSPPTSDR